MQLQDLRHWQWALVGLILGAIMGASQYYWAMDPEIPNYDRSIDARWLEDHLAMPNPATGAHPYYHSLVVRPYGFGEMLLAKSMERDLNADSKVEKGKIRFIEKTAIVKPETGLYSPGRFTDLADKSSAVRVTFKQPPDKKQLADLKARGFKQTAQVKPTVFAGTMDPGNARWVLKIEGVASVVPTDGKNTIHSFLEKLKAKRPDLKISYQYAWWLAPQMQFALWTAGGVVVVGGLWPFLVNILAFGQLLHPPREKPEVDLRKVKAAKSAKLAEKPPIDTAALDAQIATMEANLQDFMKPEADEDDAAHVPAEPAIRKLTEGPLASANAPAPQEEKKDYAGEFYPTVTHVSKKPKQ